MPKKTLILIIGLFLSVASFSQKAAPPIEEVAAKFYNTYDISNQNIYVFFEKRVRQWKVRTMTFQGANLVPGKSYLYFNVDSGGYKGLPFDLKRDSQFVDFNQYIDTYQIANFHLHRYFGYNGWYNDVIAHLSGRKKLSDSSLYSLARAFSAKASAMLTNQSDDGLKNELLTLPMARNCMTSDQRAKYKGIETQAIRCMHELNKQNKNFQTLVGNIAIKYGNEVMVEFHTYLTYADSFAETFPLPDSLYPDSIIQKAKRVLGKCPPDAILLALGDNDFYPILYVQHHLGLRKDVYLINENLIAVDRFIYMASQPQFKSNPIKLSVNYEQYKDNINDFLLLKDSGSAIEFGAVIDTIQKGHRNTDGVLSLPGNDLIIKRTTGKTDAVDDNVIRFKKAHSYLLKNEWVLLDIINNLHGRRLCCQTPFYEGLVPLNDYFVRIDDDLYLF